MSRETELAEQLEALPIEDGELDTIAAGGLVETWSAAGVGLEALPIILRFMENHPSVHFGSPGPLVHFVERARGAAYEEALLTSIARRPTALTAWMLNRVANAAKTPEAKRPLIEAMERARRHPQADEDAVSELTRFLAFQAKGGLRSP